LIVNSEFILKMERRKSLEDIFPEVNKIIEKVSNEGDRALFELTEKFDGVKPAYLKVPNEEIDRAYEAVDDLLIDALEIAKENISRFHYITSVDRDIKVDFDDMILGKKYVPVESAGLYIPGGRASYPSTALMAGLPAKIAGVERIVACTPPNKEGKVNELTLIACDIVGIDEIYAVGGVQAIAALAYSTETIKKVDKIVGPGNAYVTAAKILVQKDVAIDMPAGPSEILIIADETANIRYIAADVLAQLEHDPMAIAIVLCTSQDMAEKIEKEVKSLVDDSFNLNNFYTCVVRDIEEAIEISNHFAPEHLSMMFKGAEDAIDEIKSAGSVFIGDFSPVAAGDYASGTNHILPTSGFARMFSGVSVETFLKHITYQKLEPEGLKRIGNEIMRIAQSEGLIYHKKSVEERLNEC